MKEMDNRLLKPEDTAYLLGDIQLEQNMTMAQVKKAINDKYPSLVN